MDESLEDLLERIIAQPYEHGAYKERNERLKTLVAQVASEHVQHSQILQLLFAWSQRLHELYQDDTENANLLEIAVISGLAALQKLPDEPLDHLTVLYRLGPMMQDLFDHSGEKADLDAAVEAAREVCAKFLQNSQWSSTPWAAIETLAATLNLRYLEFRDLSDLDEALRLTQKFDDLPTDLLEIQARSHESMYERNGLLSEIDKAIKITEEIVRRASEVGLNLATALSNLSRRFRCMSRNTSKQSDLEKAIDHARRAIELSSGWGDVRASCLSSLSAALTSQYDRTGGEKIISEAIEKAQEALDLPSQRGQRTRAVWMNDLSAAYLSRYVREQELSDAAQAILLAKQALDIDPKWTSQKLVSLNLLLLALSKEFERSREKKIYEEATQVAQLIISCTEEEEDPARRFAVLNLGWLLQCQYKNTGDISDLNNAIKAADRAITLIPKDDPAYASALSNLGTGLVCLYEKTEMGTDLGNAIKMLQRAVSLTPDVFNEKVPRLRDLAGAYKKRYIDSHSGMKDDADLDMALNFYKEAIQNPHGLPLDRIECARGAISIYVSKRKWDEAGTLAEETLKLLPLACRRYTSRDAQQRAISQVSSIASLAASLSLQTGEATLALQQLEFGRGIILGYTIDDRGDLLALRRDHQDLERKYRSLRHQVDADEIEDYRTVALSADLASEWSEGIPGQLAREWREEIARELGKERREALAGIKICADKIRQLSGYERFQMSQEIDELKRQATEGPIFVVNVSDIRADAIIITPSEVRALHLPEEFLREAPQFSAPTYTHMVAVTNNRKATVVEEEPIEDIYAWLWTNCVKLILNELETMGSLSSKTVQCPRVWWIGCGIASSFPFHAAGLDFGPASSENTLSRVVSSYTPTIKALAHSRLRASIPIIDNAEKSAIDSILLVTMPTTVGQRSLPGVDKERNAIQSSCRGVYKVKELRLPTAESVLEELDQSRIAHFACHGLSDPTNPYESHLLLQKEVDGKATLDKLTMLEVSKLAAEQQLWVAFLSACSTVHVKASKFADEGLHLASAFQMAGFAHVIGALWPANDDACARIAGEFYTELNKHNEEEDGQRVVAEALWKAVMRIRSEPNSNVSLWAPFVHIGA